MDIVRVLDVTVEGNTAPPIVMETSTRMETNVKENIVVKRTGRAMGMPRVPYVTRAIVVERNVAEDSVDIVTVTGTTTVTIPLKQLRCGVVITAATIGHNFGLQMQQ